MVQSNRALKSTKSSLCEKDRLSFRGDIFVEDDVSEDIDWLDVVENNLLWASLRASAPGSMPFFPINLSASTFNGSNIPSRRIYSMKGSINGFSHCGSLELGFRSATPLPTPETMTHLGFKHLTVNAVGTIMELSMSFGSRPGLGPEYSIVLVHEVNFKQVIVDYVISPTLATTIGLNSGLLGCRAWFCGLLIGVDHRRKRGIVKVVSGRVAGAVDSE